MTSIGVVGSKHRSSTDLLVEWMEYDRLTECYDDSGQDHDNTSDDNPYELEHDLDHSNEENDTKLNPRQRRPIPKLPKCLLPSIL